MERRIHDGIDMRPMTTRIFLLLFSMLGLPGVAAATAPVAAANPAVQPLETIAAAARARLETEAAQAWGGDPVVETEISVGRLDPRLRLPACTVPLEAELPPGARSLGAMAVGVRCQAPAWSVFVQGRLAVRRPVVVMAVSRPRGATLAAADLLLEPRDLSTLPGGYLSDPAELIGQELRRAVQARTVLLPGMTAAPELVRRGERVILQAQGGVVAVQVEGEALSAGALGDRIQVRNLSTRRVVEGTVGGPALVHIALPRATAYPGGP